MTPPACDARRPGDVLLTADDSALSRLLRWYTRSAWSHSAIVVAATSTRPGFLALEVAPPVCRIVDDGFYRDRRRLFLRPPITLSAAERAAQAARRFAIDERPYPLLDLVGFLASRRFRAWLASLSDGSVCSAVVASVLAREGLKWRDADGLELDPLFEIRPDTIADQAMREDWAYSLEGSDV